MRFFALTTLAATLAACSSIPDRNVALDDVRMRYNGALTESAVTLYARDEIQRAGSALQRAEAAHQAGEKRPQVDHLAYLADQRVTMAQETGAHLAAQAVIAGAAAERDRMRLALRTREADAAQTQLVASTTQLAASNTQLAAAEQDSARKSAALAEASRSAQQDQARLARRDSRVDSLEQQLRELNAKPTERGMVITLGDTLFDSGQSHLRADSARGMTQLADFMKRYPQRRASIEGFTDSMGSDASNLDLSDRRARAVVSALVGLGVGGNQLSSKGHGESLPVADNNTAAGRQMNRRVEVIFVPEAGDRLVP